MVFSVYSLIQDPWPWPFSCNTLLGASLKIDTFPLCELTIINYYWTNSEQELWKMRQKTACPGSGSDILMPFWQTRERERIQTSFSLLLSHHLQPAVVNKHSSENYFMHHLIETLLHFVRFPPHWERAGARPVKCFIGLVMARTAAIVLLELWSMGQNQNQKCQYETEYEAIKRERHWHYLRYPSLSLS